MSTPKTTPLRCIVRKCNFPQVEGACLCSGHVDQYLEFMAKVDCTTDAKHAAAQVKAIQARVESDPEFAIQMDQAMMRDG